MSILLWIICATVLGGVLSALAAAVFAIKAKIAQIPVLISYAVGALLGAVFLSSQALLLNVLSSAVMVVGGIMAYFALQTMQQ